MAKLPTSTDPGNEARLDAVLESVSEAFYAVDTQWCVVVFNRAAEEYFGASRDQVLGRDMWEMFPQGRGTVFETYCRAAMDHGVSTTVELPSRLRPERIVELKILQLRGGGVAVISADVTERKQADARQRLLVNELNHRVKNALATVQAIAAQSLRGPDVSAEAFSRFMARLMALARANDVLVAENWTGASLMAIAVEVSHPHGAGERFSIAGPPVHLAPQSATAMALGLHELATNAAKYGALSTPEGRVALSWALDGEGEARRLRLTWRESGGPQVKPPGATGFGARLIQRGLAGELRAETKLDYAADGLVFTLVAPLGDLLSEG